MEIQGLNEQIRQLEERVESAGLELCESKLVEEVLTEEKGALELQLTDANKRIAEVCTSVCDMHVASHTYGYMYLSQLEEVLAQVSDPAESNEENEQLIELQQETLKALQEVRQQSSYTLWVRQIFIYVSYSVSLR